jgi:hypothetical protein
LFIPSDLFFIPNIRSRLEKYQQQQQQQQPSKMSAWGKNGSARSCDALLKRVENNDPTLTELIILPLKSFTSKELILLAQNLSKNTYLTSIHASGHTIDNPQAYEVLGNALPKSSISSLAIGDSAMGDVGISALCKGLQESSGSHKLNSIDLSWKGM